MEFPSNPFPTVPCPAIPLHLNGFLAGETIQVQGDTGELQFSVQLNLRKKEYRSGDPSDFTCANIPEIVNFSDSVQSTPSSPYFTPTTTGDSQDHNADANANANAVSEASWSRSEIVTRLRSGVLSRVNYNYPRICGVSRGSLSSKKEAKSIKSRIKCQNVFDKMLKRRSSPTKPCNSYAFFLVKNWGAVKHSSFVETSKRLSKRWCKLSHDIKKEYEDMALKDNARYKRQCMLLRDDAEQQAISGLLADSN